ncbi:MAG: UDP-N-acetylmuramoyl-L-alanine--D-glutamate ligase [Fimbriimonas sp.]
MIEGKRIAIFGLGRSGLAIGRAALALGANPHVYDEKPLEALPKRDAYDQAVEAGIPVTLWWGGTFEETPDMLVANPAIPKDHPKLLHALAAGIQVISEVEFAYRISRAPIVAITGTNGKSTTTVMTYLALRACGIDAVLCGNIFGSGYPEIPMTEAALASTPDQVLVAEISSFQLEWVHDFRPVAAGITNIWPDHLDRYMSFEDYAATKHRIFQCQGEGDFAVVKANDPVVVAPGGADLRYRSRRVRRGPEPERDARDTHGRDARATPTVLTFGATAEHARVEEMDLQLLNQRIRLDSLPFSEPHNYVNAAMAGLLAYGALAAIRRKRPDSRAAELIREAEDAEGARRKAARSVYDVRTAEPPMLALPMGVVEGLREFKGLAHRMEALGDRDGVRVINNSMCTNPDAVIKSAMAVRDPAHLLIGGVNKGLDFGPLKHYLANHRHRAYLFGSDAADLNAMLGGSHPIFRTLEEAFAAAKERAVAGEVIMLAPGCASTDQFRDFRERGDVFRTIAKEWLNR